VQTIRLIDHKPRLDLRSALLLVVLLAVGVAAALVVGRALDIEDQVVGMVIIDIMLVTAIVCFYDLTYAIIFWFFALTYILRYTQLNLPGIPDMSGPRFMLVVMWGVFALEVALRRRRPLGIGKIEWAMLLFMVINLISMIHHQNLMHSAHRASPITSFMNFVVFPFSVFYLTRNACSSDTSVRRLLIAFGILHLHLTVTGILEHFHVSGLVFPPDILDPEAGEGRWFGVRIRGPYLHSPIYGAVMGMGFYLTLHFIAYVKGKLRWALLVGLAATPLSVLYTLTRQVWLGWGLPLILGFAFSKRQRVVLGVLVLAALTFVVMADMNAVVDEDALANRATNENTGESRIGQFVAGSLMFMDSPIFGIGLEMWEVTMERYRRQLSVIHTPFGDVDTKWARGADAHNTFLRVAVELGIVGLIPFFAIFLFIVQRSIRLFRALPREGLYGRGLVLAFWQMMIGFLLCIFFTDPSFAEFLPGYYFAWAGIIVRRAELAEQQAAGHPIPPDHTLAVEVV
jgi:O-antigen ligase